MTTRRIIECNHCRSSEHIGWRFNKPFCDACKRPACEKDRKERNEDSEFCVCGKHYSECSCGENMRPRPRRGKRRPPIPRGYDEEQFYK